MRFLFVTMESREAGFYRRVSQHLAARGHRPAHVTWSPASARRLRAAGFEAYAMPEELERAGEGRDLAAEGRRVEDAYAMLHLREVYRTDWACAGRPESECAERTVRHFLALERIFDRVRPDVVVPEVGSESIRTAAHLIGLARGIDVLFPFYTIFPRPLRLYANTMHAPIVPQEEVRALSDAERAEVEDFMSAFIARDTPIRAHRRPRIHAGTLRDFAGQVALAATTDRRNEYLRPHRYAKGYVLDRSRAAAAKTLYQPLGERPFVYFPLHVTDDYKIKRVIPHCVDQAAIIELIAAFLPQGVDLVLKEHPLSIGRNGLALLRRLRRIPNARLVDPYTSSHELIRRSQAVAVISSTVGLEALLHGKGVMTVGQPFYSGYGVTLDVDSFREIPAAVPELLRFTPDRERTLRFLHAAMRACRPGRTVTVDASDENAAALAGSFADAAEELAAGRAPAVAALP